MESKQANLADALEHSEVNESGAEVIFTTPKMYQLYLKDPAFEAAVKRVMGKPVRITIKVGETARQPEPAVSETGAPAGNQDRPRRSARWRIRKCRDSRSCFPEARSARCAI